MNDNQRNGRGGDGGDWSQTKEGMEGKKGGGEGEAHLHNVKRNRVEIEGRGYCQDADNSLEAERHSEQSEPVTELVREIEAQKFGIQVGGTA